MSHHVSLLNALLIKAEVETTDLEQWSRNWCQASKNQNKCWAEQTENKLNMWIFGYGSLVWKVDFPYVRKVIGYIKGYDRKFWQASIDHRGVPEKPGRVVTLVPSTDPEARVYGAAYKIHRADVSRVVQHLDHREVMGYEKVPIEFHPIPDHPENALEPASPLDYNNSQKTTDAAQSDDDNILININSLSISGEQENGSSTGDENLLRIQELQDFNDDVSTLAEIMEGKPITVMMYYGSSENEHYIGPAPLPSMAQQIFESVGPSGKNREYLYNLVNSMRDICPEAVDHHLVELEEAVRELELEFMIRSPGTPIEL